jgi:hypothetical protein
MSGHARFVAPHELNHYDSPQSALDAREYASAGEMHMNVLRARQGPGHQQPLPSQAAIRRVEAALNTRIQNDANDVAMVARASHGVGAMEAAIPATGSTAANATVPPGPLVNPNSASRARMACVGLISGAVGIVIGGGGLAGILKLMGYLDTAAQIAAGSVAPVPAGGNPAAANNPTQDELAIWLQLPGATVLELLRDDATRKGAEWSVGTWNYVTTYLLMLLATTDAANTAAYQNLFVTGAALQADYADWKANGNFDPIYIFGKSAAYPDPKTDPNWQQHALRVRLDYMARITALAIATDGP